MRMGHYGNQGQYYQQDWWHSTRLQSLSTSHGMWWVSATTQAWVKMRYAMLPWYISMETWNHGSMSPWTNISTCGPSMLILRWGFFHFATLAFKPTGGGCLTKISGLALPNLGRVPVYYFALSTCLLYCRCIYFYFSHRLGVCWIFWYKLWREEYNFLINLHLCIIRYHFDVDLNIDGLSPKLLLHNIQEYTAHKKYSTCFLSFYCNKHSTGYISMYYYWIAWHNFIYSYDTFCREFSSLQKINILLFY